MTVFAWTCSALPVRPYLPSIIHPNTGNLGLPIVFFALGEPAMPYAIAFSTLVQISHFTVGVWLASGQLSWRTVLISPPLWSLLAALALIASRTPLPTRMTGRSAAFTSRLIVSES